MIIMTTTMTIATGIIIGSDRAAVVTSLSLLLALVTAGCGGQKDVRKDAAAVPTVAAVLPLPQAAIAVGIRTLFREQRSRLESPFNTFELAEGSDPLFPDDEQIKLHVTGNTALAKFASQLPFVRADAFYLYEPSGNVYWPSEYLHDGKPAEFRSAFIVHFRRESEAATNVEVIEYLPVIKIGRRFKVGHNGPGFYADIREVEPTALDRQRLLAALTSALPPLAR
jgi:hypothetical protein